MGDEGKREWLPPPGTHLETGIVHLELGGIAEISREFGVRRTTASMWHVRHATSGFPEPVTSLEMGPVFDMAQVRAWYARKYPSRKDLA